MPSKKFWLVTGALIAGVGVTAVAAEGYRQVHDRGGYFGGHHGKGHGWRRGPITKDDYDARTRSKFARMDENGDGVVDETEARKMIEQRSERRGRRWRRHGERFAGRMMRRFDSDGDGKVTKAEFDGRIAEMFARFDLDSDGRITDADLPPMMRGREFLRGGEGAGRGHRGRRGRRFMRMLRDADANGDNAVTLEEAQASGGKRFARWDRNGDGSIDQADRDALRTEMNDYRLSRFMHRFGAKADGKLTQEQFAKFRNERFARLDTDKNGELTRDEMPRRGWRKGRRWGGYHGGGRGHHGEGHHRRGRHFDDMGERGDGPGPRGGRDDGPEMQPEMQGERGGRRL